MVMLKTIEEIVDKMKNVDYFYDDDRDLVLINDLDNINDCLNVYASDLIQLSAAKKAELVEQYIENDENVVEFRYVENLFEYLEERELDINDVDFDDLTYDAENIFLDKNNNAVLAHYYLSDNEIIEIINQNQTISYVTLTLRHSRVLTGINADAIAVFKNDYRFVCPACVSLNIFEKACERTKRLIQNGDEYQTIICYDCQDKIDKNLHESQQSIVNIAEYTDLLDKERYAKNKYNKKHKYHINQNNNNTGIMFFMAAFLS